MAEEIYQQSLEIELGLRDISFQSKADVKVAYKGQVLTAVAGHDRQGAFFVAADTTIREPHSALKNDAQN